MNPSLLITSTIMVIAIVLFLSERFSADLVALLVMISLGVTGVLTPQETFSGFSQSAVITILGIFILAEGVKQTGLMERLGQLILHKAGNKEWLLAAYTMLIGAGLSLFMNNIAAASVLLPVVMGLSRRSKVKPSRLLMPLAFATILGGMATLFTTTNLVASSLLHQAGIPGYKLLDFLPLGIPIVFVGIGYMVVWGRKWLPLGATNRDMLIPREASEDDLIRVYKLEERLMRVRIAADSPLIGMSLFDSEFRERYNLNIVAIERDKKMLFPPSTEIIYRVGDIMLLEGKMEDLINSDLKAWIDILPPRTWEKDDLESPMIAVVEALLTPRSALIDQSLQSARFREKYGMVVLAIWRNGRPIRTGLSSLHLAFGDAMLLQGSREQLTVLRSDPDLIILDADEGTARGMHSRGWLGLIIMVISLFLAVIKPDLIGEIMLGGAMVMVLTKLLSMEQAYRAVEWRSIFLIAGMLPLGIAIEKSGLAAYLFNVLITYLGSISPLALLMGMVILSILFTQIMHGAAVAVIMVPIAIHIAQRLGIDPRSLAMGVTLATSMAFLTPLGHPVNVLVMGPGGYKFRDYLKVGLPLTGILLVIILLLLPVFWPLVPK